jgi:hypothetical protein
LKQLSSSAAIKGHRDSSPCWTGNQGENGNKPAVALPGRLAAERWDRRVHLRPSARFLSEMNTRQVEHPVTEHLDWTWYVAARMRPVRRYHLDRSTGQRGHAIECG